LKDSDKISQKQIGAISPRIYKNSQPQKLAEQNTTILYSYKSSLYCLGQNTKPQRCLTAPGSSENDIFSLWGQWTCGHPWQRLASGHK